MTMEIVMENQNAQNDEFILFPAVTGGGALVRRSQIAGARANGRDGAILYAMGGPAIYTTATISQLAQFLDAQGTNIDRD